MHIYEAENCQSVVDPSTRSTFESPPVRKGLMGLAKDIQRLANLSIAPLESMEVLFCHVTYVVCHAVFLRYMSKEQVNIKVKLIYVLWLSK